MTPSMVSVALPLLVAGALAVVVRFRFRFFVRGRELYRLD